MRKFVINSKISNFNGKNRIHRKKLNLQKQIHQKNCTIMNSVTVAICLSVYVTFTSAEPYTIEKVWGDTNGTEIGRKEIQLAYQDVKPNAWIHNAYKNSHSIYAFTFPEVNKSYVVFNEKLKDSKNFIIFEKIQKKKTLQNFQKMKKLKISLKKQKISKFF